MAAENSPSFSVRRRWAIFSSVVVSMVAVIALVGMVNYLAARYPLRGNWSAQMKIELSPLTIGLLKSITNDVKVTIYYDRDDQLYSFVTAWLDEYRLANPKISVRSVDYRRDATEAVKVKTMYGLASGEANNLVIFECQHRCQVVPGKLLAEIDYAAVPNDKQPEYERKIKAFKGEEYFTWALLSVNNPKPLTACYLTGVKEHPLDDEGEDGYVKFKSALQKNNIIVSPISLDGTNLLTADCNVLIIAGPRKKIPAEQLDKIQQYLAQGGRLFVMFNYETVAKNIATGLEAFLVDWGVNVGKNWINDPENTESGSVMAVKDFNPNHPLVKPLAAGKLKLGLLVPRSIGKLNTGPQNPEGPKVDELAFTGRIVKLNGDELATKGPLPVMVAVEKGSAKGVFTERGSTRILVVGDSMFLDNQAIEFEENASFAALAVNWLLDQKHLMDGIGSHPVKDYKLMMTQSQMRTVLWIFLGAMPGAVLLVGGLVWLRRRH